MSTDGGFDVDALPRVPSADDGLPGTLDLGAFSMSLNVADIQTSLAFYTRLGFVVSGGDADDGWLILRNGQTTLGLFQGIIERNTLTFNPGLTPRMERIERFTDVRELQRSLESQGLTVESAIEPGSSGAGSFVVTDPDGNPVLVDQFF